MNKNPIVNEPGYENLTIENSPEARKYIKLLEFHNHLIAVVQMIENIPPGFVCFKELIESKFCELYKENIEFISKKATSSDCDKEVNLKMYSLHDVLSYKHLLERYKQIYTNLSIVYGDNSGVKECGADGPTEIEETKESASVSLETPTPKKRGPEINANDYEVGYVTTAQNRNYIVKEVNGKGGNTYKRWVLKK
jgi:hypothetical protein